MFKDEVYFSVTGFWFMLVLRDVNARFLQNNYINNL